MQTSKILFTDLDGTLLDDEKNISQENRQAISRALSQGHRIVVASGRPLVSARAQSEKLGLNTDGCYVISYNGACIYDFGRKQILFSKAVPLDRLREIFDAAYSYGIHAQTYSDTNVLSERDNACIQNYSRTTGVPMEIVPDVPAALSHSPYKVLFIHESDRNLLERFRRDMQKRYLDQFHLFFSDKLYLELVTAGVSKGAAVETLCQLLSVPIANSIAVGDAENDISMIQAAHTGAVMANASDRIKQFGNYITEADNNHSGVAEVIRKFLLS